MLRDYLVGLSVGRAILWCYFIWYLVVLIRYFDPDPRLWATSLGISLLVGVALCINARASTNGPVQLGRWQTFRFFLIPFCVSSFGALVKDRGFFLVFSPRWDDLAIAVAIYAVLGGTVAALKSRHSH
ncbi:MAG TPA: hypothetical protein V6D08_00230 [Candidatus Obscuribacterales bacterium]